MAQPRKPQDKPETEEEINARMEQALKRAMSTPHQTDKELVERRRRQGTETRKTPKG